MRRGVTKQQKLLVLLLRSSSSLSITLSLLRSLLQQNRLALSQCSALSVVDALQPVSKAGAAEGVHGVGPEGLLVEERAHLDADLPEADSNT